MGSWRPEAALSLSLFSVWLSAQPRLFAGRFQTRSRFEATIAVAQVSPRHPGTSLVPSVDPARLLPMLPV